MQRVASDQVPRCPSHTADPHHQRAPSLGQIHQELENEQEAQVNRLLHMIRVQQDQLTSLQTQGSQADTAAESAVASQSPTAPTHSVMSQPDVPSSPTVSHRASAAGMHYPPRSPLQRPASISRHSSRSVVGLNSNASSPSLRPQSSAQSQDEWSMGGTRDESSFYQAETHSLQRENQMLKSRIRELERQIGELNTRSADMAVS